MANPDPRPLLVTPGEPAGIGPDIALTAWREAPSQAIVHVMDPHLARDRAALLGIEMEANDWRANGFRAGLFNIAPVACQAPVTPGEANPANGRYVLETLEYATRTCLAGEAGALVTGPINKAVINESGVPFSGHTEWLADRCGVHRVVMMLACPGLRVALVTTHLPLRAVADAITPTLLTETLTILLEDLQRKFGLAVPRISVCGLNPHAGEGGHLGREEIDVIQPVLDAFRADGHDVVGPLPADTAFTPKALEGIDAVLAMYHDQGLPVLKNQGFGEAINITLGLPIIRTSVDHGTAFDLAGTGRADAGSLAAAIDLAFELAGDR